MLISAAITVVDVVGRAHLRTIHRVRLKCVTEGLGVAKVLEVKLRRLRRWRHESRLLRTVTLLRRLHHIQCCQVDSVWLRRSLHRRNLWLDPRAHPLDGDDEALELGLVDIVVIHVHHVE